MVKKIGKNIAILILGPLGDVINTSGIFKHVKKMYPEKDLFLITTDRGAPAAVGIPEIKNVYILDKSKKDFRKNIDTFKFAWSLRKKFDTVVVLDNSLRAAIFSFLTFAKRRVGRGRELRELFLTDIIPYKKEEKQNEIHISEHYARCLKPLGLYKENLDTYFEFSKEDNLVVEKLLEDNNLSDKNIIGFCPACRLNRKNIRIEDSIEIIKNINSTNKYSVVLVGGKDIAGYVSELKKHTDIEFVDFTGKTTFAQSAALINKCQKFISVDTSCMHLAFARKTPTMAIFFNNLGKKWGAKNLEINRTYTFNKNKEIQVGDIMSELYKLPDKKDIIEEKQMI